MEGIELYDAGIDSSTRFDGVVWTADYIVPNELNGQFDRAEGTYRTLKQHRQERGDYHTAGEFYFREMECIRKRKPWFQRLLWTVFYKSTCGYGERPTWTFFWALAVIIFWGSIVYPIIGIHNPDGSVTRFSSPATFGVFIDGLSLSLITFATLGYGNRYPIGQTGELLAGCEALLGMLLSSIFIVTFAKRVVRG